MISINVIEDAWHLNYPEHKLYMMLMLISKEFFQKSLHCSNAKEMLAS